ncbi:hypothetical protein [Terrihalobacillus insolitus]|uniref:hypothetical protein n=1 Tax=Terrihalobacillus insolitus TaxID=2950438 RepID=UPI0023423189|nr:hypothetical protein [Terrihalobacillus insolitus]MDC3413918.1 hypothetical protein [Terrihalobacillus insolitus]
MKQYRKFQKVEQSSMNALSQFELTIARLKKDNEELSSLHAEITSEIEKLKGLKENVLRRIANNDNAINGLTKVLNDEI